MDDFSFLTSTNAGKAGHAYNSENSITVVTNEEDKSDSDAHRQYYWKHLKVDDKSKHNIVRQIKRWWVKTDGVSEKNTIVIGGDDDNNGNERVISDNKIRTPVSRIAIVDSRITKPVTLLSPSTVITVAMETIEKDVDFTDTPLVLFYMVSPALDNSIYILGCKILHPSVVARKNDNNDDNIITLETLARRKDIDVTPYISNQGVPKHKTTWFIMPNLAKNMKDHGANGQSTMDQVLYRLELMIAFWKHQNNSAFVNGDMQEILLALHRTYFDLSTQEGRELDNTTFWMLASICGHDSRLWEPWNHWERTLLTFRIQSMFSRERHFGSFLMNNGLTDEVTIWTQEEVDVREKQLYRLRHPKGPLPNMWVSVNSQTVTSVLLGSPHYDVEGGRTVITYRDFAEWVWSQMAYHLEPFFKNVRFNFLHPSYPDRPPLVALNMKSHQQETPVQTMIKLALSKVGIELGRKEAQDTKLRIAMRANNFFNGDLEAAASMDLGTRESLINIAKKMFPPCQQYHVWNAFVNGNHPKNMSRLSLTAFLVGCGYTVDEIESVLFLLYSADENYIKQTHGAGVSWTFEFFKKQYGGSASSVYKSIMAGRTSPYGCASLVEAGANGQVHGCPFAKPVFSSPSSIINNGGDGGGGEHSEIRSILEWSGNCNSFREIEDIMSPVQFPQMKCCKYYEKLHPDRPIVVKHPNQYMRSNMSMPWGDGVSVENNGRVNDDDAGVTGLKFQKPVQPRQHSVNNNNNNTEVDIQNERQQQQQVKRRKKLSVIN